MFVSKTLSKVLRYAALTVCSLFLSIGSIWAQDITVTGLVTDKSGEPVVGAFVLVQGTNNGATTEVDGSYRITAPSNGTLEVSSMGYKTVTVPVNKRAVINVSLEDDALMLEDVVIVGFGSQKKENLTGAVASINTSKALESRPIADVGRGLQGMTPGLNVRVGTSEVGSDPLMRIRGQVGSYVGSSSPLILLDNVEIPSISILNPEDIESISVLKDAASASIYGAKGAFGVILITSKKGAKTETVNVSYSGYVSFQSMAKNYQMADVDGLHYTVEAAERVSIYTPVGAFWLIDRAGYNAAVAWKEKYGNTIGANDPMVYGRDWYVDGSNRKIGVRTYNPYEYLVRDNAPTQNHNVTISGKKGNTTFNANFGYLGQSGMMKTTNYDKYERYNARVSIDTRINKFMKFHTNLMYSRGEKNWAYATSSTTADVWYYVYRWGSTYPMASKDEYGNDVRSTAYETSNANKASRVNEYASVNVGTTITPVKNWDINFDYTYSSNNTSNNYPGTSFYAGNSWAAAVNVSDASQTVANEWNQYNGLGSNITAKMLNVSRYTGSGSNPDHIYRDAYVAARQTYNATTTYDLNLSNHALRFMLGMQAITYQEEGNWSRKTTLMDYTNAQFDLATGTQTSGGGFVWNSLLGYFGRINYGYKDKYLLEANIRYDGTSKFPSNLRWQWYPSVSGGWVVTGENFMQGIKHAISHLKVRASWGSIGDQTVSSSLYIPTMSRTNSAWIHGGAIDVYYTTPAAVASDITWQNIVTTDVGLDARFLNGDLGFTFDWYQRDTKGMIVGMADIGYNFGTSAPRGNYGSLSTRGWELAVDYGHIFENGFSLAVNASIADAKTTITGYGNEANSLADWYVGKTYGEIWGYQVDRLYQNEDFARDASGKLIPITTTDGFKAYQQTDASAPTQGYLNSGSLIFGPGDVKFKDLNGDGVVNRGDNTLDEHGDLSVIGNTTPRYEYSFRVDLGYKGFDFSVFFQGVGKRDMWGSSSMTLAGYNSADGAMAQTFAGDFWYETFDAAGNVVDNNYDAFYPRAANCANSSIFNMTTNDKYLLNMAYLRMKNVTLGYTMPNKISKKAFIEKLRIYVSLENMLTFDHLNGLPIDPEVVSGYSVLNTSNYNSSRTGVGAPAFKSASVGLQITF